MTVLKAIFLGMNEAGKEVYSWLNGRENVEIKALLTEKEQLELVEELNPDIVISSGFEHKVPKEIIEIPEKGIINLHPSYLPYNRGAHPYIWPILNGTPAGVSIHFMNEEIDQGEVIAKREVEVLPEDTGKDLHQRLTNEQIQLFKENWENIVNDSFESQKQDLEQGQTNYKKDLEDIREINLNEEIETRDLIDILRALSYPPHRTAYFERHGQKYFVDINIVSEERK